MSVRVFRDGFDDMNLFFESPSLHIRSGDLLSCHVALHAIEVLPGVAACRFQAGWFLTLHRASSFSPPPSRVDRVDSLGPIVKYGVHLSHSS